MIVGPYPSRDEDAEGWPLAGDGGRLTLGTIRGLGLDPRRDVYATMLMRCAGHWEERPEGRRRAYPEEKEIATCKVLLLAEIEIVRPAILVLHGRVANQAVLGDPRSFGEYSGHIRQAGKNVIALSTHNPYGLVFGGRQPLQHEYRSHWEEVGIRLDCLGRAWRPDAEVFSSGWTYENRGRS